MHRSDGDTRSRISQMERQAAEFMWHDAGADLAKLDEIARKHSPDGQFNMIERFDLPEDPHAEGWLQMSPVIVAWRSWLEEKYDGDTSFVILAKFGQIICGADGPDPGTFAH